MAPKGEEFRRAWPVLLACMTGTAVSVSPLLQYSLGTLIEPLSREFGWSRSAITALALFKATGILIMAVVMGALADRFGARRVAILSQIGLAAALAALSQITGSLPLFYAAYLVTAMIGAGTLPMVWGRALIGWFVCARGLALGLSLVATGLVGALTPSYVNWLVETWGWRAAFLGLAALPLVLGLPLSLAFFREPPAGDAAREARTSLWPQPTERSFGEALRTGAYWQMMLAFVVGAIGLMGIMVNSIPLLTDRGLDSATAAAVAGLFGISVSLGRIATGLMLDLFKAERAIAILLLMPAIACAVLLAAGSSIVLCGIGIMLVGLASGMEADAAAYLTAKYFGRRHYGATYGLMYALVIMGGGAGPLLVSASFDRTGSYDAALGVALVLFLASALLMAFLRQPNFTVPDAMRPHAAPAE